MFNTTYRAVCLLCASLTLCASLLASGPLLADEGAQPQLVSQVNALLGGIDYAPSPQEWEALGPDAAPILQQIAADTSLLATTRARAISALANFDDPQTRPLLEAVLTDAAHPELLKRNAVTVLSLKHGAASLPVIEPLLAADSYNMREAAVRAVAHLSVASPQAKATLQARLPIEESDSLRALIERSLAAAP